MKILWVSHFVPWPPKGGNLQRSYYLMRALAEEATVDLISFHRRASRADGDLPGARAALREICRDVEIFPIPNEASRLRFAAGLARNLAEREPYTVMELRSRPFRQSLARRLREGAYDAVHFDTIDLAPYRPLAGEGPAVLNHHNIESLLFRRRAPFERNPLAGRYVALQSRRLARAERRWYRAFDMNLFVSEADREAAREEAGPFDAEVVPNGVDTEYYRPGTEGEADRIVWVGGLGWFPNRDAVAHLLADIWPRIRAARPEAELDLVGAAPRPLRPAGWDGPGVKVHGFVDDLRPLVARAKVFVVPIRVGGGTRLKILDAMAMGKAIVSTTIGAEGLDGSGGEEWITADAPEEFARAVVRLLGDGDARRRVGAAARKGAERRYAWRIVGEKFRRVYRDLVRAGGEVRGEEERGE
ncbi:MAG: glycosyltransferase family 4 protein [Candidatus Eisenbacteria bacterium]